jgi:MFS family permease
MRLVATLLAGSIWGLCNGALAMVFAFGPTVLTGRGASLTEASATTSLVLWPAAISLPASGMIGDRLGRPDAVLLAGCAGFAAALALALPVRALRCSSCRASCADCLPGRSWPCPAVDAAGSADAASGPGIGMLAAAIACLGVFRLTTDRLPAPA